MKPFPERLDAALQDPNVRSGLLDFQRAWRVSRDEQIADLEAITGSSFDGLRSELASIKRNVLADLPRYVAQFRSAAEAAGAVVVEVSSIAQANRHILELCQERDIDLIVKGKSMVSEEMDLNAALAGRGVEAVETDLGEWLLQLDGDHPSHLVMPAIHKRRHQIAELLTRVLRREFDPDDIDAMVKSARTELRAKFLAAGMGLSGANALVAESGTVMLVSNEGNNRMATSLPPVHVVTAGFEKLIPTYGDVMKQVRLLARSATGQSITTYTSFVTGPAPGHELHIVLLDNGRSRMADDPDFVDALACIRCGACANVCPPYQVVGGHAFGHIYTGAIGLVNTEFHHGLEAVAGPQSLCVSCGACASVCPVGIPLPAQILEVRRHVAERQSKRLRRFAMQAWSRRRLVAAGMAVAAAVASPFRSGGVTRVGFPKRHVKWRTPPAIPFKPGRRLLENRSLRPRLAETEVSGQAVTLFLQCITDRLAPEIALGSVDLLESAGASVVVPKSQHCCGLPAFDGGEWEPARRMAQQTIEALEGEGDVVTPAPSCAAMITHEYRRLFRDDPGWLARAERLAARTSDLVSYLSGPARLPTGSLNKPSSSVTVHRFCQSGTVLGMTNEMESLLEDLAGAAVVALPENGVCCGFGGSTSATAPEVAAGILARKLECADTTGAPTLISDNPGCILHMRGGADASGRTMRVVHVAEFLSSLLPRDSDR